MAALTRLGLHGALALLTLFAVTPIGFGPRATTIALAVFALAASGCSTLGYYSQSIGGHFALLNSARPVPDGLTLRMVSEPTFAPLMSMPVVSPTAWRW